MSDNKLIKISATMTVIKLKKSVINSYGGIGMQREVTYSADNSRVTAGRLLVDMSKKSITVDDADLSIT